MKCRDLLILLWIGGSLTFFSCEKWDLERLDFVELTIAEVASPSADSARVTATIEGLEENNASDHGFVWQLASAGSPPTIQVNHGKLSLGARERGDLGSFTGSFSGFLLETDYQIVAYAVVDNNAYYSQPYSWNSTSWQVLTAPLHYEGGRTLTLEGQLQGTAAGAIASNHGFVWSFSDAEPDLDNKDGMIDLGNRRNDEPFTHVLEDLQEGQQIYYRAYAVLKINEEVETRYGAVETFDGNLKDVWRFKYNVDQGTPAFSMQYGAVSFTIDQKVYVCLGADLSNTPLNTLWEYDPAQETWTQRQDYPGAGVTDALAFVLDGKGFVGLGAQSAGVYSNDIYIYDPASGLWDATPLELGSEGRYGAFHFVIDDKAYLGGGSRADFLSDVYLLDPANGLDFEYVGEMPAGGRHSCFSFALNGKGYIGGGYSGEFSTIVKDFWQFDPEAEAWTQKASVTALSEMNRCIGFGIEDQIYLAIPGYEVFGESVQLWAYKPSGGGWTQKASTASGTLGWDGIGFTVGGKGYVGLGEANDNMLEYEPATDSWTRLADFPGGQRLAPLVFVIDEVAYIGMGGGTSAQNDLWAYYPPVD